MRPALYSAKKCSNTRSQYSIAKLAVCSLIPILSHTACASARSSIAVQYSVPSSSSQFFINRPSTLKPACWSKTADTEESTPPDIPTMTCLLLGLSILASVKGRWMLKASETGRLEVFGVADIELLNNLYLTQSIKCPYSSIKRLRVIDLVSG